jgi:hypothetical protein
MTEQETAIEAPTEQAPEQTEPSSDVTVGFDRQELLQAFEARLDSRTEGISKGYERQRQEIETGFEPADPEASDDDLMGEAEQYLSELEQLAQAYEQQQAIGQLVERFPKAGPLLAKLGEFGDVERAAEFLEDLLTPETAPAPVDPNNAPRQSIVDPSIFVLPDGSALNRQQRQAFLESLSGVSYDRLVRGR